MNIVTTSNRTDMLDAMKEARESIEAEQRQGLEKQAASLGSGMAAPANPMSRNFVHAGSNESSLMKAKKAGKQAAANQRNRQNAILAAGMAELERLKQDGNYANRAANGRKWARYMQQEQQTSTHEASERNLEEIRDEVERRAREAMLPDDMPDLSQASVAAPPIEPPAPLPVSGASAHSRPDAPVMDMARPVATGQDASVVSVSVDIRI